MRPKVVITIMIVAVGLLGMVIVLKGLAGKGTGDAGNQASGPTPGTNSASAAPDAGTQSASNGTAPVVSDEMRAAIVEKEQEEIQELVGEANGTNNPLIISALVEKVANPEEQVGKAALAGLVQLNDTNAVPALQQVEGRVQSVHMKAAIEDTITYLNLPDSMPAVPPPDSMTNLPAPIPRNLKMNPAFLHTNQALLNRQNNGQ
jgi:hypothetical protein